MQYVQRVSGFKDLVRRYWFDAAIAALAIEGMLELIIGRDNPNSAKTLWFALPAIPFAVSLFPVGLTVAFLLGNLRKAVQAGIGLLIVVVSAVIVVYEIPGHTTAELIFIPVEFAIAWVAGFALRERAEQAEAAELRATLAERERDAAARIAVAEERARIARELHDIVAHAVSVMV